MHILGRSTLWIFLFSAYMPTNFLLANGTFITELEHLSLECFKSGEVGICRRALSSSESLQRYAGLNKNYSCQTSVIGLGAYFLMSENNSLEEDAAAESIQKVKLLCKMF